MVCSDSCPSGQKLCSHAPTNFLIKGKISSCDSLLSTPLQKLAIYHKNPTFKDIMLVCCWKDLTLVVHIDTSSSHSSPIKFIIIQSTITIGLPACLVSFLVQHFCQQMMMMMMMTMMMTTMMRYCFHLN